MKSVVLYCGSTVVDEDIVWTNGVVLLIFKQRVQVVIPQTYVCNCTQPALLLPRLGGRNDPLSPDHFPIAVRAHLRCPQSSRISDSHSQRRHLSSSLGLAPTVISCFLRTGRASIK